MEDFSALERYTFASRIKPRVRSLSDFSGKPDVYEIDLPTTTDPRPGQRATKDPIECKHRFDLTGSHHDHRPVPHRMAIIIHAGHKNRDRFFKEAVQAASGGADHRYLTNEDDRCDHALALGISTGVLFEALNSSRPKKPEPIIDNIRNACIEEFERTYDESDVPVRMFMFGPSILAFAMGAFLPAGARLVAHDSSHATPSIPQTGNREVVAIIDGDDVGASSERYLLSGDLETAST